jgi:hypothetical protein
MGSWYSYKNFDPDLYKPPTARCDNAPDFGKNRVVSEWEGCFSMQKNEILGVITTPHISG